MTIKQLPFGTQLVDPVKFDDWIYPVNALVTSTGVQYATVVTNQTATYADLFSIDTHTYYPYTKGLLTYVYVNISVIVWAGTDDPLAKWQLWAKNEGGTWTAMSGEESLQISTENSEALAVGKRLEGYLLLSSAIDKAPFSIRLQFKSDSTAANDLVSMRLKNDTVIRMVGIREVR